MLVHVKHYTTVISEYWAQVSVGTRFSHSSSLLLKFESNQMFNLSNMDLILYIFAFPPECYDHFPCCITFNTWAPNFLIHILTLKQWVNQKKLCT